MKILFYLEPHPIRERYESFSWIGKEVCKMLQDTYVHQQFNQTAPLVEIKLLVSRHYSKMMSEFPKIKSAFLGLTSEENNSLSYFYDDWNEKSIDVWASLMKGEGEVSEFYKKILRRVKYKTFDFDVIVYWSTNGAIKSFAIEENLYSISMELGCTRKPLFESVYIDPFGVNGNAVTRKLFIDEFKNQENSFMLSDMPLYFQHGKAQESKYNVIFSRYSDEIYKNVEKNILIPLQLDDDSNLILFSPYRSILEFLEDVLPVLINAGYRCFIKPHPGAKTRAFTKLGHEKCLDYCLSFDENVFWIDDLDNNVDYFSFIHKMKAVVTINSSLGFESLLLDKIVIVQGESAYDMNSLPSLEDLLLNRINMNEYQNTIQKIINVMINNYLVPKDYAFRYDYFIEYILKAMRIYDSYMMLEEKDFSKYFFSEKSNTKDYFLLAKSNQDFLKNFQQRPMVNKNKENVNQKLVNETSSIKIASSELEIKHKRRRKVKKLFNDPIRFFIDSKLNIFK